MASVIGAIVLFGIIWGGYYNPKTGGVVSYEVSLFGVQLGLIISRWWDICSAPIFAAIFLSVGSPQSPMRKFAWIYALVNLFGVSTRGMVSALLSGGFLAFALFFPMWIRSRRHEQDQGFFPGA